MIQIAVLAVVLVGCAAPNAAQRADHERACSRFAAEAQVELARVSCVEQPRPGAWFCSLAGEKEDRR